MLSIQISKTTVATSVRFFLRGPRAACTLCAQTTSDLDQILPVPWIHDRVPSKR